MSSILRGSSTASVALLRLAQVVGEVHSFLVSTKARFDDEIRRYPTPIPRCDAQFNFLYEQRARLQEQIHGLTDVIATGLDHSSGLRALDAFVHAPVFTEFESEQTLRSRAAAMVAAIGTESQRNIR